MEVVCEFRALLLVLIAFDHPVSDRVRNALAVVAVPRASFPELLPVAVVRAVPYSEALHGGLNVPGEAFEDFRWGFDVDVWVDCVEMGDGSVVLFDCGFTSVLPPSLQDAPSSSLDEEHDDGEWGQEVGWGCRVSFGAGGHAFGNAVSCFVHRNADMGRYPLHLHPHTSVSHCFDGFPD